MKYWFAFCLLVSVCAKPSDEIKDDDDCEDIKCVGEEYECIDGRCFCASGYILNHFLMNCVKCPGLGEKCFGQCCNYNTYNNATLHCWHGTCQLCYDAYDNWVCRDNMKDIVLISSAQIAMGAALVFGIIGTFLLMYKLCAASTISPLGHRPNSEGRLSIGSLQLHVEERLRDAPPRYTRTPASGSSIYPAIAYLNNGFVHDSSIPPPPYSPQVKNEDNRNRTLHI